MQKFYLCYTDFIAVRMMRGRRVVVVVALLLAAASGAHADPAVSEQAVEERTHHPLDPSTILEAAREGRNVKLPTAFGEVSLAEWARATHTFAVLTPNEHGGYDAREAKSNVWRASDPTADARAVLVLTPDELRAQITTPQGVSAIEPTGRLDEDGMAIYAVFRADKDLPDDETALSFDDVSPPGPATGTRTSPTSDASIDATVTKSITVYVDTAYVNNYGASTWPNQVDYMVALANHRFADVSLSYSITATIHDSSFDSADFDYCWNLLLTKSYLGAHTRALFGYTDYQGGVVGRASNPGRSMMSQHAPDASVGWTVPSDDFERAYIVKHELGHNNNADHDYAWDDYT